MTRLDWEKNRRERLVREHGQVRTDVTRGRAVPPSDAQVAALRALGYSGRRPATTAELERLRQEWKPDWCPVRLGEVVQVSRLRGENGDQAAARLQLAIDEAYLVAVRRTEVDTGLKEKGRKKVLARIHLEHDAMILALGRG